MNAGPDKDAKLAAYWKKLVAGAKDDLENARKQDLAPTAEEVKNRRAAAAAAAEERKELKDLSAQIKLVTFEQDKANHKASEASKYFEEAYQDLDKFYDQYATVNMSGPEKEVYEQMKAFIDVSGAINKYQLSLTSAKAEYDKLIATQEASYTELENLRSKLASNGMSGAAAEQDSRVIGLQKALEKGDDEALKLSKDIFELNRRVEKHKRLVQDVYETYRNKSVWESMQKGMKEAQYTGLEMARDIEQATVRAFDSMTDALVEFVQTGKFNFKDLASSIINDITRIVVKAAVVGPIATYLTTGSWSSSNTSAAAQALGVGGMDLSSFLVGGGTGSLTTGIGSSLSSWGTDLVFEGNTSIGSSMISAGDWMSSNPYATAGIAGGLLTAATKLLTGAEIEEAVASGVGTGLGSWAGLALTGGNPLGGFIGGALGSMLGGLFDNGPDTFWFSPASDAYGVNYNPALGFDSSEYKFLGGDTDSQIYKVYGEAITSIQDSFDDQIANLLESVPESMVSSIQNSLSSMDLAGALRTISAGEFEVSNAEEAINNIATKYAERLSQALGTAYGDAMANYIDLNGIQALVGNDNVWNALTDAVKEKITQTIGIATAELRAGNTDSGISRIAGITSSIAAIAQAMSPITEMLETADLTDYELSLRSINKQFDEYAAALRAAGVDLDKYTDLEKARNLARSNVVREEMSEWASSNLSQAETNLRNAFSAVKDGLSIAADAQREALSAQHDLRLEDLNKQLELAQDNVQQIESVVSSLTSTIEGMRLESEEFTKGRRQEAQMKLQSALFAAQAGNFGPSKEMGNTLDILSESSTDLFASFEDYQRDYWSTVNAMKELQKLSDAELTSAKTSEQLLQEAIDAENRSFDDLTKQLDEQLKAELEAYDKQLDALLGINNSILTISQASANFSTAKAVAKVAGGSSGSGSTSTAKIDAYADYFNQKYAQLEAAGVIGTVYEGVKLDSVASVVEVFIKDGLTPETHWEQFGKYEGLDKPSFAVGTDYVPYDMTANIHKGERITPAAYNRSDATNEELLQELQLLRAELSASGIETAKWTQKTYKIVDEWNGGGMPEVRA